MSEVDYNVLVFGAQKLNPKDIVLSSQYSTLNLNLTAIADNLFSVRNFQALVIYAGAEQCEGLARRFQIHAPHIPLIILADTPSDHILSWPGTLWYADPSDRSKFLFSLRLLWRHLLECLEIRAGAGADGGYTLGQSRIFLKEGVCLRSGKKTQLIPRHVELIRYLVENRGRIVPRAELMEKIWRADKFVGERVIDTHVVAIRKIIGDEKRAVLQTCHGLGYRLNLLSE